MMLIHSTTHTETRPRSNKSQPTANSANNDAMSATNANESHNIYNTHSNALFNYFDYSIIN